MEEISCDMVITPTAAPNNIERSESSSPLLNNPFIDTPEEYKKLTRSLSNPEEERGYGRFPEKPANMNKKRLPRFLDFHKKRGHSHGGHGEQKEGEIDEMEAVEKAKERIQKEKEKKKRSSWLPDPENRWPIQGWS